MRLVGPAVLTRAARRVGRLGVAVGRAAPVRRRETGRWSYELHLARPYGPAPPTLLLPSALCCVDARRWEPETLLRTEGELLLEAKPRSLSVGTCGEEGAEKGG